LNEGFDLPQNPPLDGTKAGAVAQAGEKVLVVAAKVRNDKSSPSQFEVFALDH